MLAGLRCAATSRALWLLTFVLTAKSVAVFCFIFWIPLVISDLLSRSRGGAAAVDAPGSDGGASHDLTAVALTTVPYACAAVAAYLLGWSSEVRDERRAHTYVPFGIAAAVLLAAPLLQVRGAVLSCEKHTRSPCPRNARWDIRTCSDFPGTCSQQVEHQ